MSENVNTEKKIAELETRITALECVNEYLNKEIKEKDAIISAIKLILNNIKP